MLQAIVLIPTGVDVGGGRTGGGGGRVFIGGKERKKHNTIEKRERETHGGVDVCMHINDMSQINIFVC